MILECAVHCCVFLIIFVVVLSFFCFFVFFEGGGGAGPVILPPQEDANKCCVRSHVDSSPLADHGHAEPEDKQVKKVRLGDVLGDVGGRNAEVICKDSTDHCGEEEVPIYNARLAHKHTHTHTLQFFRVIELTL